MRSSWSAVSSPESLIAMPVDAPSAISRPSRTNGAASARRTRSAAQIAPSSASGPVTRMANSSPPRRATTSPGRTELVSRLATMPEQLVADVVALRVVDRLEAVQVQEEHGRPRPRASATFSAVSTFERNSDRFASPVSPSENACWVSCSSSRRRSDMSRVLRTSPRMSGSWTREVTVVSVSHHAPDLLQIGNSRVIGRPGLRAAEASAASSRRPSPGRSRAVNRVPTSSFGSWPRIGVIDGVR